MLYLRNLALLFIGAFVWIQHPLFAGLISPEIGWQAELSMDFHDVSGTVTILDADTIRVDDFTYDGGGPRVYLYLGVENTASAFLSGLEIGPALHGTAFDGTQDALIIDLPSGETLEGYHAISVWCTRFEAVFGSGEFRPAPVPEPTAISAFIAGLASLLVCRRSRIQLGAVCGFGNV